VPSLPSVLMKTAVPPEEVAPKIWPIKQLLFTFIPVAPIQITLLAVVTFKAAKRSNAKLLPPVVFASSAESPIAVLPAPVVLLNSAFRPLAVLVLPVLLRSA